jgi:hypothetical protein
VRVGVSCAGDLPEPETAPRLCTKNPSKACVSGCTPLKYDTSANADCDSPVAISRFGRNPLRPPPARTARATWVKMSNEKPSPGCSSVP